jgi:hypothetical protein
MRTTTLKFARFITIAVTLFLLAASASAQLELSSSAAANLKKLEQTYAIEIAATNPSFPVKSTYGVIDGKRAELKELESYISWFAPEFSIYPQSLVRLSQLKRVVLCKELSFAGQRRNAIPDFEHDTLYLDASRGSYYTPYMRKVMHHEFFHIIDWRDDGKLYQDEVWSALNAKSFKYGSGGINAQDKDFSSILTNKFPGFLNYYSTTGVEEDKAELFANLIVDPAYVESRIKQDEVLSAKVRMLLDLLKRFCPDLNDQFWKQLKSAPVRSGP